MASIIKRDSSYTVVYYDKDKHDIWKQKWKTFKTFEEAEKRKRMVEIGNLWNMPIIYTFRDLVIEFIGIYGKTKWSYSTFLSNSPLLNNYILNHLGSLTLTSITPYLLDQYFRVIKNDVSADTILKIHKLLKNIFKQAYIWGYIERNPANRIVLPKVPTN